MESPDSASLQNMMQDDEMNLKLDERTLSPFLLQKREEILKYISGNLMDVLAAMEQIVNSLIL